MVIKNSHAACLVCAVMFFIIFLVTLNKWILSVDSVNWDSVSGRVLEAYVSSNFNDSGSDTYTATIKYEYFVHDKRHTSKSYDFIGATFGNWGGAQARIDRTQNGELIVYYNPKNPAQSVIDRSTSLSISLVPISTLIVAILAASFYFQSFRKTRVND